jgi:hypothetical protein
MLGKHAISSSTVFTILHYSLVVMNHTPDPPHPPIPRARYSRSKGESHTTIMFAPDTLQPAHHSIPSGESISHLPRGPSAYIASSPTNTRPHASCTSTASSFTGRLQVPHPTEPDSKQPTYIALHRTGKSRKSS